MAAENCTNTELENTYDRPVLADVIEKCQRLSGRYELTDQQWIGHINSAQQHLDRLVERKQEHSQNFYNVPAGTVGITFSSQCRVIDQAWVIPAECDADGASRHFLEHISMEEMHDYWAKSGSKGIQPCFYTEALLRRFPGFVRIGDIEGMVGFNETTMGPSGFCNGIIIYPATEDGTNIEIVAKFYDDIISAEWPYSWWLINHEDLVVKATMRELEGFMRNSQGVADYDNFIAQDISHVDLDDAEQRSVHIRRFYG